jgi:hypothetical protein
MAQTGYTPILSYASGTAAAVPLAANLTSSASGAELAVNYADGKLFYKDSGGVVQTMASKGTGSIGGSTTQVQFNNAGALGGSASLTWNGTVLTSSGFSGPLNGTVGATTASTGAFTTLSASGTTTLSGNQIISVTDNTNAALRITQLGTGDALLVEDAANPDSSPFVIDASGNIASGLTSTTAAFEIYRTAAATFRLDGDGVSSTIQARSFSSVSADSGPILNIARARGTKAASTIVQSGDLLAQYRGAGYDGAGFIQAANIEVRVDGTPGLNDMPGRLVFSTTADGSATPTERMRITSAGNVGIGSTAPQSKLSIQDSPVSILAASGGAGEYSLIAAYTGNTSEKGRMSFGVVLGGVTYFSWGLSTGAAPLEKMRLNSAGNLGLMTTPSAWGDSYKSIALNSGGGSLAGASRGIDVINNAFNNETNWVYVANAAAARYNVNSGVHSWFTAPSGTAGNAITFTQAMTLDASGNLGLGSTSPTGIGGYTALKINNATSGAILDLAQADTMRGRLVATSSGFALETSGSIPILFAPAGTECMRIDSSGNVGIGAVPTSAAKANITSTSAGASTIALSLQNASNTISSETVLDFVTNTSGAGVRSAQITAINTNGSTGVNMLFKIGNGAVPTEAMRITSLGGLQLTKGIGVSSATPAAGGVAFPATAVAVADANTLDDYEEGTWTPVVTFTGGNGDLTTSEANGVYTKIGRLVQIAFNVEFSETTAAGNLTITGVPFISGGVRTAAGCFVDNMTALTGAPVIQIGTITATITLIQTRTGIETAINNLNTGALSRVRGSLSYSI